MTTGNIIAGSAVLLLVTIAVIGVWRSRKKGGCAGCSGCGKSGSCGGGCCPVEKK